MKRGKSHRDRRVQREDDMKTKAGIGVMHPQARDTQKPWRGLEQVLPESLHGCSPVGPLVSTLSASRPGDSTPLLFRPLVVVFC